MYAARTPATTTASAKAIWILCFASLLIMRKTLPDRLPNTNHFKGGRLEEYREIERRISEEDSHADGHRTRRPQRAEKLLRPRDPRQHRRSRPHLHGQLRARACRHARASQAGRHH